ncbi:MAG: 50S ribosomal protein L30 [Clostridiales Family XIII bacterium]|jgi:large subunit ribosomal protein L30|nr:50S ribosomal protein L30 [Clostridiales Family XIII bacterium]
MAELKIKLKKGLVGSSPKQRKIIEALGLKKIGKIKIVPDSVSIKGSIKKVEHLVEVVK